jgi:hypothetical protein
VSREEISISSATGMSDGTNPFVLVLGCRGETVSAFSCSALVEGVENQAQCRRKDTAETAVGRIRVNGIRPVGTDG